MAKPGHGATSPSLRTVVRDTSCEFWSRTNVHGLGNAYNPPLRSWRTIWWIIFITGLAFTIRDTYEVFNEFFEYPHSTHMEVLYDSSAYFPAVTICNQNRLDCVQLVNASLHSPGDPTLLRLLNVSLCLTGEGLDCVYVWELAAGTATQEWISDTSPDCLKCETCTQVQRHASLARTSNTEEFEDLTVAMGCSTTCPQQSGVQGREDQGLGGESEESSGATSAASSNAGAAGASGRTESAEPAASTQELEDEDFLEDEEGNQPTGLGEQPDDGSGGASGEPEAAEPTQVTSQPDTSTGGAAASGPGPVVREKRQANSATTESDQESGGGVRRGKLSSDDFAASASYDNNMRTLTTFMILGPGQRVDIGTPFTDFVKGCTFLGFDCKNSLLFNTHASPEYGNCFSFNMNITESEDAYAGKRRTELTGEQYSLDLLLYLRHFAYPPRLTATKGARIMVHPPDQVPDLGEGAMLLSPNTATSLAIEQLTLERLPSPYSAECIQNWEEAQYQPIPPAASGLDTAEALIREAYSVSRCKKMCLQETFIETCFCFHPLYPIPGSFRHAGQPALDTDIRPCLLTARGNDTECTRLVLQNSIRGIISCTCPSPCFEKGYNVYQSMAQWPRTSYQTTAYYDMGINTSELTPQGQAELPTNILQARVFFKTLNTQSLVQVPQYSIHSLFSSLGGALSLYLGITLVMVFEIIEFVIVLFWNMIRFARGCYKPTVQPEDVPKVGGNVNEITIRRSNGVKISFVGDLSGPPVLKKPFSASEPSQLMSLD